ncbi:hypothetical protein Aduo_013858 [Ancylostoma duodenale]
MDIVSQILVYLSALRLAAGCAATSPGTSTPRLTTTTPATTTTTAPNACKTCTTAQVSFDKANGDPMSIDSSFRVEAPDPATGCLRLTAICAAQPGFFGFMEFNINQGGPQENLDVVQVVEALLECRNGAWYYRDIPVQVASVQCIQVPP